MKLIKDPYFSQPVYLFRGSREMCVVDRHMIFDTPPKTNMAMEHPPFEDVFPIEDGDFILPCQFSGV